MNIAKQKSVHQSLQTDFLSLLYPTVLIVVLCTVSPCNEGLLSKFQVYSLLVSSPHKGV